MDPYLHFRPKWGEIALESPQVPLCVPAAYLVGTGWSEALSGWSCIVSVEHICREKADPWEKAFLDTGGSLVNQTAGWQQQGSSNSRSLVTRVGLGRAASSLLSLWQHCSSKKTSCQHLGIFVVREHCNVLPQTERADARLAFRKQLTLIKWCDFPWSWHSGSILGKQKACGDDSLVFACGLSNFFSFWLFFHVFFFFF